MTTETDEVKNGQRRNMTTETDLLQEAVACIREIADPIKFMRDRLNDGEQLNGGFAISLSNDPEYLKKIARAFLAKIDAMPAGEFVMVPREPTDAMLDAGLDVNDCEPTFERASGFNAKIYRAMLAASQRHGGVT